LTEDGRRRKREVLLACVDVVEMWSWLWRGEENKEWSWHEGAEMDAEQAVKLGAKRMRFSRSLKLAIV